MEERFFNSTLVSGNKPDFHCASVSWGAGSLYMLLKLLEDPCQKLNMVLFVNMGKEFDALLRMRDKVLPILQAKGIAYVEIDVSEKFEHLMFHKEVHDRETGEVHRVGHGFCGAFCRYGTRLKLDTLSNFYKQELANYHVVEYVGLCAGEEERLNRNLLEFTTKKYPLVELGVSKQQVILECYKRGFLWDEPIDPERALEIGYPLDRVYLYEVMSNVSCYCCRNKNLTELRAMLYLLLSTSET